MKRRLATLTVIAVAGSILVSILAVSFLAKPEVRELGFHTPVNLSESKTNAFEQKIAAVDSDVYVVWREARRVALDDVSLSYYDIIFRASNDGGKSFGAKINLSNGTQSEESPLVAAAGNQVYLTWKAVDPVERTYPLFFRASDDHGKTFGDIIRITATGESAAGFDVAAASDTVIIAYESYIDDVVYKLRASHDNGVSFAQPIDYYQPRCAGAGIDVETSVDGNHVYLTAGDSCAPEGGDEILFRKSDDGGVSLGSVKRIDLGNYQQLEAVGKEKLFLSWRNLQGNVMLAASVDGGTTFNSPLVLGDGKLMTNAIPRIAATEKSVYMIWDANVVRSRTPSSSGLANQTTEAPINRVLFFRASVDNTASFGPLIQLTTLDEYAAWPALDALGSTVAVVWSNVSSTASAGSQIFYIDSDDNGLNFNERITIEDNTGDVRGFSRGQVVLADHNDYVTWWSGTFPDSFEVYITRKEE